MKNILSETMKWKIAVLFLLVLIVIISGCIGGGTKKNCDEMNSTYDREMCYKDAGNCEKISIFEDIKALCYRELAEKKKDINLCEKLKGKAIVASYFYPFTKYDIECKKAIIKLKNSLDFCNKLGHDYPSKEDCYQILALYRKDPQICEKCVGKEYCYRDLAMALGDETLCEKIKTDFLKKDCLAYTKEDESYCEKEIYESIECFMNVAILKNDYTLCENIDKKWKNRCYFKIALQTKNKLLCDKIIDYKRKGDCKNLINGDYEKCERKTFGGKIACYRDFAIYYEDESYCEKIKDEYEKFICLKLVKNQ